MANAVGLAIAEAQLAGTYNRDGHAVVDHRTWAIVSDGDLMEGVAAEAASLAGHLKLGKLVCLYDDNEVSLSAGTAITFTEDRAKRFEAYGWQTIQRRGRQRRRRDRPRAAGGRGRHDASLADPGAHPPGLRLAQAGQLQGARLAAGRQGRRGHQGQARLARVAGRSTCPTPPARKFLRGADRRREGRGRMEPAHEGLRRRPSPSRRRNSQARLRGELPEGWDADMPSFPADAKGLSTRVAGKQILAAIAQEAAVADGRLGRPRSVDLHQPRRPRRLRSGARPPTRRRSKAPTPAARAGPAATCTSACASTRWARSSTAWRRTAASSRTARPS